jgi:hypothetical protein
VETLFAPDPRAAPGSDAGRYLFRRRHLTP